MAVDYKQNTIIKPQYNADDTDLRGSNYVSISTGDAVSITELKCEFYPDMLKQRPQSAQRKNEHFKNNVFKLIVLDFDKKLLAYYNMACVYSKLGKVIESNETLKQALV